MDEREGDRKRGRGGEGEREREDVQTARKSSGPGALWRLKT